MFHKHSIFGTIYFIIGLYVAFSHGYFEHINSLSTVCSAVAAVFLWPLVLLGVRLVFSI